MSDNEEQPVFRLYEKATGAHRFSADAGEITDLQDVGWAKEGVAFYAISAGSNPATEKEIATDYDSKDYITMKVERITSVMERGNVRFGPKGDTEIITVMLPQKLCMYDGNGNYTGSIAILGIRFDAKGYPQVDYYVNDLVASSTYDLVYIDKKGAVLDRVSQSVGIGQVGTVVHRNIGQYHFDTVSLMLTSHDYEYRHNYRP